MQCQHCVMYFFKIQFDQDCSQLMLDDFLGQSDPPHVLILYKIGQVITNQICDNRLQTVN